MREFQVLEKRNEELAQLRDDFGEEQDSSFSLVKENNKALIESMQEKEAKDQAAIIELERKTMELKQKLDEQKADFDSILSRQLEDA